MNVFAYAAMTYGITAVISLAVVAVIVGINGLFVGKKGDEGED